MTRVTERDPSRDRMSHISDRSTVNRNGHIVFSYVDETINNTHLPPAMPFAAKRTLLSWAGLAICTRNWHHSDDLGRHLTEARWAAKQYDIICHCVKTPCLKGLEPSRRGCRNNSGTCGTVPPSPATTSGRLHRPITDPNATQEHLTQNARGLTPTQTVYYSKEHFSEITFKTCIAQATRHNSAHRICL